MKAYDFCLTDGSETLDDKKIISMFDVYKRELVGWKLNDLTRAGNFP